MIDPIRLEGMKIRIKKSGAPIDQSTIKPEVWKDHYGADVAYLLQEIERLQKGADKKPKKKTDDDE